MIRKWRFLLFVLAIIFLLSCYGAYYAANTYQQSLPRSVVVDRKKVRKLQTGYSYQKVCEILGLEPGDYTSKPVFKKGALVINIGQHEDKKEITIWQDDSTCLMIQFDENYKLTYALACYQDDGSYWHIYHDSRNKDTHDP